MAYYSLVHLSRHINNRTLAGIRAGKTVVKCSMESRSYHYRYDDRWLINFCFRAIKEETTLNISLKVRVRKPYFILQIGAPLLAFYGLKAQDLTMNP